MLMPKLPLFLIAGFMALSAPYQASCQEIIDNAPLSPEEARVVLGQLYELATARQSIAELRE